MIWYWLFLFWLFAGIRWYSYIVDAIVSKRGMWWEVIGTHEWRDMARA